MLKQSPSRNQRSKGFKVKHALHIFLLLAICIWLLYQMKRSHEKKKVYGEESSSEVLGKMQSGGEFIRLGRRDLRPLVKDASFGVEKHVGIEKEVSGAEDEEIDGREQERIPEEESEAVEDVIDDEDREMDEGSEEDKGIDFEDANLLEDQSEVEEDKSDLQEAREEHYKDDDDVEKDVVRDMRGISRSLRKFQVETVDSADNEEEKETETYYTTNIETKSYKVSMARSLESENASLAYSDNALRLNPLIKDDGNEQSKLRNGSLLLLVKDTASLNGTTMKLASTGRDSYLQTAIEERSGDPRARTVRRDFDSTLSTIGNSDFDGSLSIVSQGVSQLDATSETKKSTSIAATNENAVSSGESNILQKRNNILTRPLILRTCDSLKKIKRIILSDPDGLNENN